MAILQIDLEKDNLLYYSRLLAQLAMIEDIAGGGLNVNGHVHKDDVSNAVAEACADAHLHLTDGEPPLPDVKPHEPFNPFAGNVSPLAPPAPPAPSPAAVVTLPTVPVAPTATSIVPPPPPGASNAPSVTSMVAEPAAVTQDHAESDDSEGIAWDARIHSAERGKKVDGTWKLKRGIDKDYAASVLAELRGKSVLGNSAPPPPTIPSVRLQPGSNPSVNAPPLPTSVLTPPIPADPVETITFKSFMEWLLPQIALNATAPGTGLSRDQLTKTLAENSMPAINQLNTTVGTPEVLMKAKQLLQSQIDLNQLMHS